MLYEILNNLASLRKGVPTYIFFSPIDLTSFFAIREQLKEKVNLQKEKEIDIILNSPGGDASTAYRLIRTFRERYEIVNIIIPFWAKSAATLFAFGGSRLVLHEFGELGPIDAQIKRNDEIEPEGEYSSALISQSSLRRIEERSREGFFEMFTALRIKKPTEEEDQRHIEFRKIGRKQLAEILLDYSTKFYQPLLQKIDPTEIGEMSRVLEIGSMYARRILKQYTETSDEKIADLLDFLVFQCPDHGYVVDYPVIKPYLNHVIKANEPPFSDDYYKELDKLSFLLMRHQSRILSFFENLQKPDIIKERQPYEQPTNDNPGEKEVDRSEGPGSEPSPESGKKNV